MHQPLWMCPGQARRKHSYRRSAAVKRRPCRVRNYHGEDGSACLEEKNNRLLGHLVHLQIEDSGCTAEMGTSSAMKIAINTNTIAVIGTFCSGSAATASKIVTEAGMIMISGSNSAPSLTSVKGGPGANRHPGYFRVMFNGTDTARAAAHFAFHELGITRAAAVNDGSLYTSEYSDEFAESFKRLGGDISTIVSINRGDQDMVPAIKSILLAGASCVFFPLYQKEAEFFIRQTHKVKGADQLVYIGGGALLTEHFLQSCGSYAKGMFFATVMPPEPPPSAALKHKYIKRYGEPPQHFSHAHTYDAARLVFSAIESAAARHDDGTLVIDRKALLDFLYGTRSFKGVTGNLECDEFGDCSADTFKIVRLDNPSSGLDGLKSNIVYTYTPSNE